MILIRDTAARLLALVKSAAGLGGDLVGTSDAQTLTNKTISGASNTISNVPDSALSSNVPLKNAASTFTAAQTVDSNLIIGATSGIRHYKSANKVETIDDGAAGGVTLELRGTYKVAGVSGFNFFDCRPFYNLSYTSFYVTQSGGTYGADVSGVGDGISSAYQFNVGNVNSGNPGRVVIGAIGGASQTGPLFRGVTNSATVWEVTAAGGIKVGGGTEVKRVLSATASKDFGSIGAGLQASLTITVTGAVAGNDVIVTPPAAIEAGLSWSGHVSAADTVTIRVSNQTAGAIDPAAAVWRATVLQY